MLEPVFRSIEQDVFTNESFLISRYLDSYSVFDWGRMPDGIPLRGKFQNLLQSFLFMKFSESSEWNRFLRSPDALSLRKHAPVPVHFNELGDRFPMPSNFLGVLDEKTFRSAKPEPIGVSSGVLRNLDQFFLVQDRFAEIQGVPATVMGKSLLDFSGWRNHSGQKALPFEIECADTPDFPKLTLKSTSKVGASQLSFSEAMAITGLSAQKLEECLLRAAWIFGFVQFQLKSIPEFQNQKTIRIWMGLDEHQDFVFLSAQTEFSEIDLQLKKYYSCTLWGKIVQELRKKSEEKGDADWKKMCSEPAPWLDEGLKIQFSNHYRNLISGITTCLSE